MWVIFLQVMIGPLARLLSPFLLNRPWGSDGCASAKMAFYGFDCCPLA